VAIAAGRKERLTSLAGVALLHLIAGWALLLSLAPTFVRSVSEPLGVFNIREIPPPPPEPEPQPKAKRVPAPAPAPARPSGLSAPPAPRRVAPPVVAPKRIVERRVPPRVAAAVVPASGSGSSAFSSARDGTGTGSGGAGSGTGSGSAGSGSGGGGSGGGGRGGSGRAVTAPELRSGSITARDYPRAANGHQGTVGTRIAVSASGAVIGCTVTRSSGNAVLDATTCGLIRQRFRFTPARDAQGNAVPDVKGWQQRWWRD